METIALVSYFGDCPAILNCAIKLMMKMGAGKGDIRLHNKIK